VFTWGDDKERYGTLGLANEYHQPKPIINKNFENIKIADISLSEKFGCALDSKILNKNSKPSRIYMGNVRFHRRKK
jgi:hypothetical protein